MTNQSREPVTFSPEFRVKGRQPELWEPTSGTTRKLLAYTQSRTGTVVPLQLQPLESVFIVFTDEISEDGEKDLRFNYPPLSLVADITDNWTVHFNPEKRGPVEPVLLEKLEDISTHADDDIRHYSGTMNYVREFTLENTSFNRLFVNLQDVAVMAKVKVNGQYAGGVWTAPYRVDITGFVRQGMNTLEVEVVNTWVNRIIGDMKLPENDRQVWLPINSWNADSPLGKSGLIGPVLLESQQ